MSTLHLKIITPQKIVYEKDVNSVMATTSSGEITVLPHHTNLFSLLVEGIVRIKLNNNIDELAIGGGYIETDGEDLNILVSRAYGQDEIDAEQTEKAIAEAKKIITQAKDETQRKEAISMLRRSIIDMKLIKRRKPHASAV